MTCSCASIQHTTLLLRLLIEKVSVLLYNSSITMLRSLLVLLLCACASCEHDSSDRQNMGPSAQQNKNFVDINEIGENLITRHGYPVETHTVTTEDGYLLTVHRIPGSPKASSGGVKTPVLLQHGISSSSEDWFVTGPKRGLGFQLADEGYDVWMGNSRGNVFSRKHLSLSANDSTFWDFSWHEMGVYDLPAVIDHILATSSHPQLLFVGYSLGSNMFFAMTSVKPEYNQKIRLMLAMGPALYSGQRSSVSDILMRAGLATGQVELFNRTPTFNQLFQVLCGQGQLFQNTCKQVFYNFFGENAKELNTNLLPLYWSRVFSGVSRRTVEHLVQNFEVERFQVLDRNAGSQGFISHTVLYDLSRATTPVVILYANNDAIVRPKGTLRFSREVPNLLEVVRVSDLQAGHRDFVFSNSVRRLVNDVVIRLLSKHS